MTLDHVSLHTAKGHFCSLLISNIFCYPLFRSLPFALHNPQSASFNFLYREYRLLFVCSLAKRRIFLLRRLPTPDPMLRFFYRFSKFINSKSMLCVTPPCSYRISGRSVISFASGNFVRFKLPLDCTFLSSITVYHIGKSFSIGKL